MAESLIWRESLLWVPFETSADKVNKFWLWHLPQLLHDISESLCFLMVCDHFQWSWHCSLLVVELLEQMLPGGSGKHTGVGHSNDIDDQLHLLALIGAWEEREASE